MAHILIENAFVYKKRTSVDVPEEFIYDKKLGAWVSQIDDIELVNHKDFPGVSTKKCDVETGEDQKGQ